MTVSDLFHPIRHCNRAIIVLLVVVLSGCATTGTGSKDPVELQIMKESRTKHSLRGALFGGLAGAAIGAIIGHQSGHAAEGAAIGAAAGALGGAAVGSEQGRKEGEEHVGKRRDLQAKQEQLKTQIAKAEAFNNALVQYNEKLAAQLVDYQTTQSAQLAAIRAAEAKRLLAESEAELARRNKLVANARDLAGESEIRNKTQELENRKVELARMIRQLEATARIRPI